MPEKRCTGCGMMKPNTEFSPHRLGRLGTKSRCKTCENAYEKSRRRDPESGRVLRERGRAFDKRRSVTPERQAYQATYREAGHFSEANRRWYLSHKEQRAANDAIRRAILKGKLAPPTTLTCAIDGCTEQATHYHHWHGYDKAHWLDVIALCIDHHAETRRSKT